MNFGWDAVIGKGSSLGVSCVSEGFTANREPEVLNLPGSGKPRKAPVELFPPCWKEGAWVVFPETGGGNSGDAGANMDPALAEWSVLVWLGPG